MKRCDALLCRLATTLKNSFSSTSSAASFGFSIGSKEVNQQDTFQEIISLSYGGFNWKTAGSMILETAFKLSSATCSI